MKKVISSVFYTALVAIAMSSCQKGEVVQDVNSLGIGSYVTLVSAGNNIIDATNLAGSKVSASVKEYGSAQEKLIVYVAKAPKQMTVPSGRKSRNMPIMVVPTTWKFPVQKLRLLSV